VSVITLSELRPAVRVGASFPLRVPTRGTPPPPRARRRGRGSSDGRRDVPDPHPGSVAGRRRSRARRRNRPGIRGTGDARTRPRAPPRRRAAATTATLLAATDPVLTQWRLRPTAENALLLEEIYIGMVRGALGAAVMA
jgi:hypothetical protein